MSYIFNSTLTDFKSAMRKYLVLASALLVMACVDMGPKQELINGKTPYPHPESLRARWNAMEACSGIKGDFDKMHFFTATDIQYDGDEAGGIWLDGGRNEIIVSVRALDADQAGNKIFEHEAMHALLNHKGHMTVYFNGVCGDLLHVWVIQK